MDERASSMLATGNSAMAHSVATNMTIRANIGSIKQGFVGLDTTNKNNQVTPKREDMGFGANDLFSAIGDYKRMSGRFQDAREVNRLSNVETAKQGLRDAGQTEQYITTQAREGLGSATDTLGSVKTFLSPSFIKQGITSKAGELAGKFGEIGATGPATEEASSGLPRFISRVAGKIGGESGKSAAAIGDVVGHSLGLALAGVSLTKDIAGGWNTMDTDQKAGNVLGIAGGVVDAASIFLPFLTPIALGLNVASGVEDYAGDSNQAQFEKTKKGGLDDQQKQQIAEQKASLVTPTSVLSGGQIASSTQSAKPQTGGVAAF